MAKIKTIGREMKSADCDYISLVPRGANQLPFRIVKSQEKHPMLDITNFMRTLKREAPAKVEAPAVSAFVIKKGEDYDAMVAALKTEGFDTENVVEKADEGLAILLQGASTEASMAGDVLASVSGDAVMVAIKGFSPWTDKLVTFTDKVAAQGFYMGLDSAVDVLECSLFDSLYDADTSKDMVTTLGAVVDEFKAYVVGLAKGLPAAAFKAEKALKGVKTHAKQGKRNTNADAGNNAVAVDTDVDPTDSAASVHGANGKTKPVNQMAPTAAKKMLSVVDPEAILAALKLEGGPEAVEAALKAQLNTSVVVQDEDGPGEGPVTGESSDKPLKYTSAVNSTKDDDEEDEGDDDAMKAEKAARRAAKAEAAKVAEPVVPAVVEKTELPTPAVDAPVAEGSNPVVEALKGEFAKISDQIAGLRGEVDAVKKAQEEQVVTINTVVEKTDGVTKALKGTVIGGAAGNLEAPARTPAPARKADNALRDTAFGGKQVFGS